MPSTSCNISKSQTSPRVNIVRIFEDDNYIDSEGYTEHNPDMSDGLPALRASLSSNSKVKTYNKLHRVLAEGSFVLSISEGSLDGVHSSFYDLFRVAEGKLVEHWDTIDAVPPRSEWKNDNGKF